MDFHWRLSDSKSPHVSRTLLSILAVFNNAVVWMVSTRSPTSKSSRPFNNPLVTVPKAPITIGIIVTFIFHNFFQFSIKVEVLISLFTFFQFYSGVSRDSKVDNFADFLFLSLIIIMIIIYSSRVFHISISWWFFTGVWVTASHLKSPGLVSVFWPSSAMPSFGYLHPSANFQVLQAL